MSRNLKSAEKLLEKLFSSFYGMLALLDRDFNFIRVNAAYAAADNKRPEHFPGRNHFELYPNEENEAIFRHVVETGEPYIAYAKPFEYAEHPERGTTYWNWTLTPVEGEPGEIDGLLLHLQNVTEYTLQQLRNQELEQRYQALYDNAPDAILYLDLEGRFIEVNQAACKRLGYSRDELLTMRAPDINDEEGQRKFQNRIHELMETGFIQLETRHITRSGEAIPVEIYARRVTFDNKPAVLSIARDIRERLALESERHINEQSTRALLNATTDAALLVDADGIVHATNETMGHRLSKDAKDLVGKNIYSFLPPDLAKERAKAIQKVVRSGEPTIFEDRRAELVLLNSVYPVINTDGSVDRIALYSRDITEQHRTQQFDKVLSNIDRRVLQAKNIHQLMDALCADLVQHLEYGLAWIGHKETDGRISVISIHGGATAYENTLRKVGVRWDDTPEGHGPAGTSIRTGEIQTYKITDPAFDPWRQEAERQGLASAAGLPLIIKGDIVGTLVIYSQDIHRFDDPHEIQRVSIIANRLRVAFETAQDQQQLRLLSSAMAAAGSGVMITDSAGNIVWVNEAFSQQSGYSFAQAIGKTPRILQSGQQDDAYYAKLWRTIISGERWHNETVERHASGRLYTVRQSITPIFDDSGEISHFIAVHEDITLEKENQARISYLAHHDALTELPNRALFFDRLDQAISLAKRAETHLGLLFLDLDRFKPINDRLGHAAGDELLVEAARRIRNCVRESDTVARLGGDEFTIILSRVTTQDDATQVADKILDSLNQPFLLQGQAVNCGASIGIALFPDHATNPEVLLTVADGAMYAAKGQAGAHIAVAAESRIPK